MSELRPLETELREDEDLLSDGLEPLTMDDLAASEAQDNNGSTTEHEVRVVPVLTPTESVDQNTEQGTMPEQQVVNLGGLAARGFKFAHNKTQAVRETARKFKESNKGELLASLFKKAPEVGATALRAVRTEFLKQKAGWISQMEGRPYEDVRKEVIAKADSARRRKRAERQYWIDDTTTDLQLKVQQVRELPGRTKEAAATKAQEVKSNIQSGYHEARKATHDKVSQHVGRVAASMSGLTERIQSVSNTHAQAAEQHATKAKAARGENVYVQPRLFE